MTAPLPPFSGDSPQCPKCSHLGAFTEWQDCERLGKAELTPERLLRTCERCDYKWDESLNPPDRKTEEA